MPENPYPDNIFGALSSPAKRTREHKKRLMGVHHWGEKRPFRPEPGDRVHLKATTSFDLPVNKLRVATTIDDWSSQTVFDFNREALAWDGLLWAWVGSWSCLLPAQPKGVTLRYKIWAELEGSASERVLKVFADSQAQRFEEAEGFAIYYGQDAVPEWSKNARVYQVFLDRFNPGQGRGWAQDLQLNAPMGGTLQGVIEKLDYISEMGFNCIWLSPVFVSPSHHGYDCSDYFEVEPRYGSKADLRKLIERAHALGLRVLLDFVANHSSVEHPAMQAALSKPGTEERGWYRWKKWPAYDAFYGVRSMPNFDLRFGSPSRAYLLEAARYWLAFGADGFRCDYADGPSADFWVDFRRVCRDAKPDAWLFGEVVRTPEVQRQFSGGLDGTLDFLGCQAIREVIGRRAWPVSRLLGLVKDEEAYFPAEFSRPLFIDNHDMNRFFFTAEDDLKRLVAALVFLYMLPQPPIVYNGTETPLSQQRSIHDKASIGFDEARLRMDWAKQPALAGLIRALSTLREENPDLVEAGWQLHFVDEARGVLSLKRSMSRDRLWHLVLNLGAQPAEVPLKAAARLLNLPWLEGALLEGQRLQLSSGSVAILESTVM